MTKYVKNKSIKRNKTNDVPDLSGIGKVAWNFISALYELEFKKSKTNPRIINKLTSQQALSNYLL